MSSLIVETGAGTNPAANSYVTRAECDAYHAEMGNSTWIPLPTEPESPPPEEPLGDAAIIRATRSIDRIYGSRFKGMRTKFATQALEWPRTGVEIYSSLSGLSNRDIVDLGAGDNIIPNNVIPAYVKQAIFEAAIRELAVPGSMTPDLERGGQIKKVEAGSVSVEFSDSAPATTAITSIAGILAPMLRSRGATIDLEVA